MSLQAFPSPPLATVSAVGRIAPVFILASLMFNFNLLLASVARCLEALPALLPARPPLHAAQRAHGG